MSATLLHLVSEETSTMSDVHLESAEFAAALEEATTETASLYIYTQ
ncbi:hypothetical protein [Streptomyces chartreusis]|uniref:Uncharacterized protein n=1 Tax=Streptomyces chartreusis TaxID=1969 RepID=A0A7H8TK46_STRCX|nr:hypothetical protein [Streptomyces chartreusis]QKZ23428.1 hypothetical protein HUT05_42365 [Streptomyces chartreusis]